MIYQPGEKIRLTSKICLLTIDYKVEQTGKFVYQGRTFKKLDNKKYLGYLYSEEHKEIGRLYEGLIKNKLKIDDIDSNKIDSITELINYIVLQHNNILGKQNNDCVIEELKTIIKEEDTITYVKQKRLNKYRDSEINNIDNGEYCPTCNNSSLNGKNYDMLWCNIMNCKVKDGKICDKWVKCND